MRPGRRVALGLVLAAAAAGCRTLAPEAPLPAEWTSLIEAPRPFAGLYRLSCCGQHNLVLAVRGDGRHLALSVSLPPAGVAMAIWVDGEEGWVERVKERCRDPLPRGVLPLSERVSLPLDPELAAMLLGGLLPADSRVQSEATGWVVGTTPALWWKMQIAGPPPHCARVVVGRLGEKPPLLTAELGEPHGRVPGTLVLTAGSQTAELTLQAWQHGDPPSPPTWLSAPACGGRP